MNQINLIGNYFYDLLSEYPYQVPGMGVPLVIDVFVAVPSRIIPFKYFDAFYRSRVHRNTY